MPIRLGTARAVRGQMTYGAYKLVSHPTGGNDTLPVVIAQGDPRGPVFWLTAGIHGPEHAGLQVLHQLLTPELARALHGTIIAIPALNPAGLRTMQRRAYYHDGDPNRLFPEARPRPPQNPDLDPPSALETAYTRLFAEICSSANYLIDLHNAWTGSVSCVFRDRVLYRNDGTPQQCEQDRHAAASVDERVGEMCAAYGHPVVNDLGVEAYLGEKLHRSTSGAAVNTARIPAITLELGTGHVPDPRYVAASIAGLRNVLRWAGLLPGPREPVTGIKKPKVGFACRRRGAPHTSQQCIVRHLVEPGDLIRRGQPLAEIRDVWGRLVGEKIVHSDYDGWVIGRTHGIVYYAGTELFGLAVRDDAPTLQPYPDSFWAQSAPTSG